MKTSTDMMVLMWGIRRLALLGQLADGTPVSIEDGGRLAYQAARLLVKLARLEGKWKDDKKEDTHVER